MITIALLAMYVVILVAAGGDSLYMYVVSYIGICIMFLIGLQKERRRWPFARESVKWPINIVTIATVGLFVSAWNHHSDAIPAWTFLIAIGLMIVFTYIANRRGWW
ncbi:hypothetical protein C3941_19365 [Kaistia algarum]|nr:hypothetical protein C3941_19365 [Kaistia algarum]